MLRLVFRPENRASARTGHGSRFNIFKTNIAFTYLFCFSLLYLGGGGEINVCQQPRQIVLGPYHVSYPSRR